MSDKIENVLQEHVAEALSLRFPETGLRLETMDPQEVLNALLDARKRSDRLDEILANVTRMKHRAARSKTAAAYAAEDAWDHSLAMQRSTTVRRNSQEFEGPRERYSKANLDSLEEQRESRTSERQLAIIEEAYDVIRQAKFGMDGWRSDLVSILRTLSFESHLER
jgi:hypothetical protein